MNTQNAAFERSVGVTTQLPTSELPEVAICGHSNVGKSSLINCLLCRRSLARTSATPGKTATINFYRLDTLRLVDLPGYGYAKVSKAEKARFSELIGGYFADDRDCRLVVQLLDMRHPPTADDRKMLDFLTDAGIPFVAVLTKADKLKPTERVRSEERWRSEFAHLEGLTVLPFSAVTREGTQRLCDIIDDVCAE